MRESSSMIIEDKKAYVYGGLSFKIIEDMHYFDLSIVDIFCIFLSKI